MLSSIETFQLFSNELWNWPAKSRGILKDQVFSKFFWCKISRKCKTCQDSFGKNAFAIGLGRWDRIIRDGTFLSTRQFIISTENCNSRGGEFGQCFLFDKSGTYLRTINTVSNPFEIFLDGWDIKIVFPSTKHMQVVTSHSFFFG